MASPARSLACLTSTFKARKCSWIVASHQGQASKQLEGRASKLAGGRKPLWPSFKARGHCDRSSSKLGLRSNLDLQSSRVVASGQGQALKLGLKVEPQGSRAPWPLELEARLEP
ncbi:hypothetical protein NL676_004640 [Syzygium grande]|nr:hypothetical protein NL676_004640 [Syzygium grande]